MDKKVDHSLLSFHPINDREEEREKIIKNFHKFYKKHKKLIDKIVDNFQMMGIYKGREP